MEGSAEETTLAGLHILIQVCGLRVGLAAWVGKGWFRVGEVVSFHDEAGQGAWRLIWSGVSARGLLVGAFRVEVRG